VSEIIGVIPPNIPQIYISKTRVAHIDFDVTLLGNCDDVVRDLVRRCGYLLEHEMLEGGRSDVGKEGEWVDREWAVYEIVHEQV
jgi:NAD-dependent protein deacetylase SIR2